MTSRFRRLRTLEPEHRHVQPAHERIDHPKARRFLAIIFSGGLQKGHDDIGTSPLATAGSRFPKGYEARDLTSRASTLLRPRPHRMASMV